jgi:hypothetical protein
MRYGMERESICEKTRRGGEEIENTTDCSGKLHSGMEKASTSPARECVRARGGFSVVAAA